MTAYFDDNLKVLIRWWRRQGEASVIILANQSQSIT